MPNDQQTQVLIVGAGPTGLMAANQLMRFGINFIIVDPKSGPTLESRAIAVTARSLEIYQQLGLDQNAINNGKRMEVFNVFSEGKPKAEVKIGELGQGLSEYSYLLAFEQSKNETLLTKNLSDHDLKVRWGHKFLRLDEHQNSIAARIKHQDDEYKINAEYLIACDGATSPVRHQLNFSFEGGTYENKFFVADTVVDWEITGDRLIVAPGSKNFCAFMPLKGDNTYRVLGTLPKSYADREDIDFGDIKAAVISNIANDIEFKEVNWFSIYKLHHRMVDQFSKARVFLAGDAAHIHSPAGGQGMNTGLQDAYNLCWKLALVLRQEARPSLLDTYNEERLPFAKQLLKTTDEAFSMMTNHSWYINLFRKHVVLNLASIVVANKTIRPIIFKQLSQIAYSYQKHSLSQSLSKQKLKFLTGQRLPYFEQDNIYPLFTKASFHLLHISDKTLSPEQQDKLFGHLPFPIKVVENNLDDKWRKLGVKKDCFILVRPDNYIGLIFDSEDEAGNKSALNQYLHQYF